jgi:hypothetical protein
LNEPAPQLKGFPITTQEMGESKLSLLLPKVADLKNPILNRSLSKIERKS